MPEEEALPKKAENFSEWYHELVTRTIVDQRYPLEGFLTFRPLGEEMLSNALKKLEELLIATGHKKVYFPMLIPETLFQKEADHIKGFASEVFWATHSGEKKMNIKCALRPTSETAMYEMMRYWVRSWHDLPLKIFQTCSIFRYETKHVRPLIRDREIRWTEAHTLHATAEEAVKQIEEGIKIYTELYNYLAIPHIWLDVVEGVFAGAESACEAYTIFPSGRLLEMGSVNNLGQKFSRAFDVKFKSHDGSDEYVYQTCYGVSERLLAAIVAVHGDDYGLVLPPEIVNTKVVIVPIIFKETREEVMAYARKLKSALEKEFGAVLDDNEDITPGEKFYKWEMVGVPVRIEVGKKDIDKGGVTVFRRDKRTKAFVKEKELIETLKSLLKDISENMRKNAAKYHASMINSAKNMDDVKKIIEAGKAAKVVWCGNIDCASKMEKSVDAPFVGKVVNEEASGKCVWCGKKGKFYGIVGKTY